MDCRHMTHVAAGSCEQVIARRAIAGSSSISFRLQIRIKRLAAFPAGYHAVVAQLVGLLLPKQVVAGSSPVYRSKGVAPNARRSMPVSSLASIVDWRPAGRMPSPIADHASEMVSTEGSRSGRLSPLCSQPVRTSLDPPSAFGKKLGTAPVAGTVDALGSNPSSIRWSVGANPTRGTVSPKC